MKKNVQWIVGLVIASGILLTIVSLISQGQRHAGYLVLWTVVCLVSELFWLPTPKGDSVQSLAATAKLSSFVILDPSYALLAIFTSTVVGNFAFRRTKWYRALYNGSQLVLAGALAGLVYAAITGGTVHELFAHYPFSWLRGTRDVLIGQALDRRFFVGFLAAGACYILINNTLMAWLMSAMTGRPMWVLWRENCLYPEEIQGSLALVLLAPLLILLYGMFGCFGLLLLFGCLGVVYLASRRFHSLTQAQDSIVRSERMAAMGEMAEEIGRKMGDDLKMIRARTAALLTAANDGGDEKTRHGVQTIEVNVDRLAALVEGLAAFSHKKTEKVPTDLNQLVQSTVEFVRPQNRFDHVTFEINPDSNLPLVNVDPAQMQQVLINLLTNAADALKDVEHAVRRIEVDTHFDTNNQKVRITVSDNGPGIPADVLPKVFEPRFTTKATGHGYGLSLVFRIAANHRGTIRATNRPQGGAVFAMEIPNM